MQAQLNKRIYIFVATLLLTAATTLQAQVKEINPDISYASSVRMLNIGALRVSGVEGYEDYMLTSISGLSVGQEISVPGSEITEAVKKYWILGLFP
jgi:outer membrane protein insertion porin family